MCCCYQDSSTQSTVVVDVRSHPSETPSADFAQSVKELNQEGEQFADSPAAPLVTIEEVQQQEAPPPETSAPAPVTVLEPPAVSALVADCVPDSYSLEESARTFTIRIPERKEGMSLGVDLDVSSKGLLVLKVKEGLVQAWNQAHPKLEVKHGDSIMSVGSTEGDSTAMLSEMKLFKPLEMRIRRGLTMVVSINKAKYEDKKLGLSVTNSQHISLLVKDVTGGIIGKWNEDNPDKEIRSGDRIIEVDGIAGNPGAILEHLMRSPQFQFIACRSF